MDADLTRGNTSPTVTLLTGNELLGLFFRHFLGEQAQVEVSPPAWNRRSGMMPTCFWWTPATARPNRFPA